MPYKNITSGGNLLSMIKKTNLLKLNKWKQLYLKYLLDIVGI